MRPSPLTVRPTYMRGVVISLEASEETVPYGGLSDTMLHSIARTRGPEEYQRLIHSPAVYMYECNRVTLRLTEVNRGVLMRDHLESYDLNGDHDYYRSVEARVVHKLHLHTLGLKNDRQVVVADDSDCISLIHVMPHRRAVSVYQRSCLLEVLPHDLIFLMRLFPETFWTVMLTVGSLHTVDTAERSGRQS